ncbi:MAG: glycerol-3-phosphate 1-O-acyltransferase PlsY, partial [Bacteroidales bacterium]|nr:glycerol-3-phosphate 1-O-acyltransferase PlsY [Bacteroidales bacterium]
MAWFSILIGYVLGSIPSAIWLGKTFHDTDVRNHGSGNAGATNTFRVLGWKIGVVVLAIDMIKGYGALIIARQLFSLSPHSTIIILSGIAAVLGHIFPLFAGFRGGKGIATLAGVGIAVFPVSFLLVLLVFLIVFLVSKYISLSSIMGAESLPFISFFIEGNDSPQIIA